MLMKKIYLEWMMTSLKLTITNNSISSNKMIYFGEITIILKAIKINNKILEFKTKVNNKILTYKTYTANKITLTSNNLSNKINTTLIFITIHSKIICKTCSLVNNKCNNNSFMVKISNFSSNFSNSRTLILVKVICSNNNLFNYKQKLQSLKVKL